VAGLVLAAASFLVVRGFAARPSAVLALLDPPLTGLSIASRVATIIALVGLAGVALVRAALGSPSVPRGTLAVVAVLASLGTAAGVADALSGEAARVVCAVLIAAQVTSALLVAGDSPAARRLGPVLAVALLGVLVLELGTLRSGAAWALDAGYACFGAVLLGASVFGVSVLGRRHSDPQTTRLSTLALATGVLTTIAGVAQFGLTGPRTWFDVIHSGYGVGALSQALLPAVATLVWLVARSTGAAASGRAPELVRLAAGGLVGAFVAAAMLATLPKPPAGPEPGQPLLRPLDLGLRHFAVLVAPMRPGPNLVHIGDAGGGQAIAEHHSARPALPPSNTLTVSAGGAAVPLTTRPGAPGYWAVVDLPAGADTLTVTADGTAARLPVDVGSQPAAPAPELFGPDGPECATEMLGALLAARVPAPGCPARRLNPADAEALTSTVTYLAARGVTTISLVGDTSPRSVAAEALVRREAAARRLAIRPVVSGTDTVLVLSGWATAADALTSLSKRFGGYGGSVFAPWLLSGELLDRATSALLPLRFDPKTGAARQYSTLLATVFPGETPSVAGYEAYSGGTSTGPLKFYGAAQVNVPMGGSMDGMHTGGGPGTWYPSGTIAPVGDPVEPSAPTRAPGAPR
jgi:hypothetical protein